MNCMRNILEESQVNSMLEFAHRIGKCERMNTTSRYKQPKCEAMKNFRQKINT